MTTEEMDAVEARAKVASEGPWMAEHVFRDGAEIHSAAVGEVANIRNFNTSNESAAAVASDAEFIAHAREDVPALLSALRESRSQVEALTKALEKYGRHAEGCRAELAHDCDCGFVAALKPSAAKEEDYDAKAERFYRETGLMAPGKDVPAAMGGGASLKERQAAWDEWCRKSAAKETT